MLGVDPGELAGEVGEDVVLAFEHDTARSVGACDESLTGFEPGGPEFGNRDGDLVLGADRRRPSAPFLYVPHVSKGNSDRGGTQRDWWSSRRASSSIVSDALVVRRSGGEVAAPRCRRARCRWAGRAVACEPRPDRALGPT